jgi:rRNA 2'-O-methyltransferase fibrillarin
LNLIPGQSVYGEKRISIESGNSSSGSPEKPLEYRVWNPMRSKLGASIVNGIGKIYIQPGCKLLYLGAASGTTVTFLFFFVDIFFFFVGKSL